MKAILLLFLSLLFISTGYSQNFQWAIVSNSSAHYGESIIKVDNGGNLVVVTQYTKPLAMGEYLRYSLLAKYTVGGTLISQDSLRDFYIYDFEVSGDNSIYLTGYRQADTAFVGNLNLSYSTYPGGTGFIINYHSQINANVIDYSGNVSGICYNGTVVGISKGTSNSMYFYGSRNLLPGSDKELFLAKYNPNTGFIFNKTTINARANQFCPGLVKDNAGNLLMVGISLGAAQFGSTNLGGGTFLARADTNGNYINASIIPTGLNYASYTSDPLGNVYLACEDKLYKFTSAGAVIWSKSFTNSYSRSFYADTTGNLYLTGWMDSHYGVSQFGSHSFTGFGLYLTKLDPTNGNIIWLQTLNSSAWMSSLGSAIYSDGNGNLYLGGGISEITQFGATTLVNTNGYPGPTGFLTKLKDNSVITAVKANATSNVLNIYPNPTQGFFQIEYVSLIKGMLQINITDVKGRIIQSEVATKFDSEFKTSINLSRQAKGVYFIEVIADEKRQVKKVVLE